ncbi:MAG: copper chaperone PCu(A)C [Alphaproteobacteria bacterium]|nr:copper chaperone PCu(A)C [Alphaproteobacteria bacterium]
MLKRGEVSGPRPNRAVAAAALMAGILSVSGLTACGLSSSAVEASGLECRLPLGAGDVAVGYLTLRAARSDRITSVASPLTPAVEMHETSLEDGVSRMRRLEMLDLPAGERVVFEPGGRHLMIFGAGEIGRNATIPITITLQSGRILNLSFPCR